MTSAKSDVLILGGGVIGLACAHYLLDAGRSVTVLDQATVGSGSSHGNCGTLTPSHATPLAMPGVIGTALRWLLGFAARCNWMDAARATMAKAPLLIRSRALIEELVRTQQLACEFEASGTLYVFRDAAAFERSQWLPRALAEIGLSIEALDAARVHAMEPALKPGVVAGYFNPDDAHLRPDRYVEALAALVRKKGGTIEEGARIASIERDGSRIGRVRTIREIGRAHV